MSHQDQGNLQVSLRSGPRNQNIDTSICPLKSLHRKLLRVSVAELFAFLLRVHLAGAKLLLMIVALQCLELLLQYRYGLLGGGGYRRSGRGP